MPPRRRAGKGIRRFHGPLQRRRTLGTVVPKSDGSFTTVTPHSRMSCTFSAADSPTVDTMAPAWPHRSALGRGESGDVAHHGLVHVVAGVVGGLGLLKPADLADHHDRLRLAVGLEPFEVVEERAPVDGVAADPDAGADPDPHRLELRRRLVSQRSPTG